MVTGQVRQNAKVRLTARPENNPGLELNSGNGLRESYFTEDLKLVRTSEEDPYKSYTKVYTILIKINPPCKS